MSAGLSALYNRLGVSEEMAGKIRAQHKKIQDPVNTYSAALWTNIDEPAALFTAPLKDAPSPKCAMSPVAHSHYYSSLPVASV
ncbi:MAG: hypothetical protein WC464_04395 [Bdellovibrionales bacterium]